MDTIALSFLLLLFISTSCAQSPSTSWRKPTIATPLQDQVTVARAAIDRSLRDISSFNDTKSPNATAFSETSALVSQLAEFDFLTNQTIYQYQVGIYIPTFALSSRPSSQYLYYDLAWGYAAALAHSSYKQDSFLQFAEKCWQTGKTYTLANVDVGSGTDMWGQSYDIHQACQGGSMIGGTVWGQDTVDSHSGVVVRADATGAYLLLSTLLAEATSNQTYLDAAVQSADFIHSHLYSDNTKLIQLSITAFSDRACLVSSNTVSPSDLAYAIEGLANLAWLTRNATIEAMLQNVVVAATTQSQWQSQDGILTPEAGDATGPAVLVRSLSRAYKRVSSLDLQNYIKGYISVQYNSILDQARNNDMYSSSWSGPSPSTFDEASQISAIHALVGGISVNTGLAPSSSTFPSPSPSNPSPSSKTSNSPVGAIVGGVVGGTAFIALCIAAFWLRRRRQRSKSSPSSNDLRNVVIPYSEEPSSSQTSPSMYPEKRPFTQPSSPSGELPERLEPQRLPQTAPSGVSEPTSNTTDAATVTSDAQQPQRTQGDDIPVEELVRMLNARLQPDNWQEGEIPPSYHR